MLKILDHGTATANGKKLLDIIKILKDEDITLETINDNLYIKQIVQNLNFQCLIQMNFLVFLK